MAKQSQINRDIIFPYMIGDELLSGTPPLPKRYVIDLHPLDVLAAGRYSAPLKRIRESVLPDRESAAKEEDKRNAEVLKNNPRARVNRHHKNFLSRWWLLSYPRAELIKIIDGIPRYIVCVCTTKRPIFEFVDSAIRPNASLQVFPLPDDYSFGILQSGIHWQWFVERCSTLKGDFRYTSNTVFDTFPFPQNPSLGQVKKVCEAGVSLRQLRRQVMKDNNWSLRQLYRTLDQPGQNPLKNAQSALDATVREAYGMNSEDDPLQHILSLNLQVASREASNLPVTSPGLPNSVTDSSSLTTSDRVTIASLW